MSTLFLLLCLLQTVVITTALLTKLDQGVVTQSFAQFKKAYKRNYTSDAEETHRLECFAQTLEKIEELNKRDTARHGINQYADLCPNEFKSMYHNQKFPFSSEKGGITPPLTDWLGSGAGLDTLDWRNKGAVNAVKDQKMCGSCWAFSAVCAMEGAWFLAGNHLISLSEEELVQCATTAGNGCQGGDMTLAVQWVMKNGGINSERAYPYSSGFGVTGTCNSTKSSVSVATFTNVLNGPTNETLLADFLAKYGPLYIAVDASDNWQTYYGGVKTACAGRDLDHGVCLVGFTDDYWIVRNSWGKNWGESGYIKLQRGVNCDGMMSEVGTAEVK